jgi:anaerobic ribonucleoside-triphosphate reductase
LSQGSAIRDDIDKFLGCLQTSKELEEYRIKLIDYINEKCKEIKEDAGYYDRYIIS